MRGQGARATAGEGAGATQFFGRANDPRNRLLRLEYQEEQFWKVGGC